MNKMQMMAGTMALVLGLGMSGCSKTASSQETVAVQSVSMLAGLGTVGLQNKYAGMVVAQATHEIEKDSDRKVDELKVAVGDEVKEGDVLFTYDLDEIKFAVEGAELELEKLQNTIETDKKQIAQLEKEKKKASSSAQLSYSIEIQTLTADVKENEYNIKTKTSELERLKNTLNNTEVRAEVGGTIQSINDSDDSGSSYDDGQGSGNAYITLIETGTFRVKGQINELNISDIAMMEGSPVIVRSRVDASQTWSGVMGSVDTENTVRNNNNYYYGNTDETTSSSKYNFYVELNSSDGLLLGQHVFIELDQGQSSSDSGLRISSYYISREDSGDYVWAATDKDKLEKRQVQLGTYNEELDTWEITGGLSAEDYIAIPMDTLKEGMPVSRYDEAYFDQGGDMSDDGAAGAEEYYGEEEVVGEEGEDPDDADREVKG